MMEANVAHMPVVSREASELVGYVTWKDLLKVRSRMREKETRRVVFHRVRGRGRSGRLALETDLRKATADPGPAVKVP